MCVCLARWLYAESSTSYKQDIVNRWFKQQEIGKGSNYTDKKDFMDHTVKWYEI